MVGKAPFSEDNNSHSIRTLIVDDSAYMRFTLRKYLSADPGIEIVGTARNGEEALSQIERMNPDVLTLDVEMPVMDGLTTLARIMDEMPRPVVMLSSLTKEGARETIRALTLGAVDFVAKPETKADVDAVMEEVIAKVKTAAGAKVSVRRASRVRIAPVRKGAEVSKAPPRTRERGDPIVCIGTSTGGPRALNTVIPGLPGDLQAAIVIVQHMPAGFTRSLADRLNSLSAVHVKEAENGDYLQNGLALLAPGGTHLEFDKNGKASLTIRPTVHGVRPAVDITMSSLADHFGERCVSVIMTGMGRDGTNGAALVRSNGGRVIVEDEASCVVWGMPRSVFEAEIYDEVVELKDIASAIDLHVNQMRSQSKSASGEKNHGR